MSREKRAGRGGKSSFVQNLDIIEGFRAGGRGRGEAGRAAGGIEWLKKGVVFGLKGVVFANKTGCFIIPIVPSGHSNRQHYGDSAGSKHIEPRSSNEILKWS